MAVSWGAPGHARTLLAGLAVAGLLAGAAPAGAVGIDYGVVQGTNPQFHFSFLHSATGSCCGVPSQFHNSGTKLFRIAGTLSADWNPVSQRADVLSDVTLQATVLDASVPAASPGDVFQFVVKAGSFLAHTPNGRAQGELHYELFDPDDPITPVSSGVFYVFPETSFPTAANRVASSRFNAWANNWRNGTDPVPTGGFFSALGIDVVTVPGPAPWALLASALTAAFGLRPRR